MQSRESPPVVTVLGHVDSGKTTLLDTIRKTNIAQRESGGITQKIGAYQIETVYNKTKRKITFIDTPGHEAFLKMRGRGVLAADIALLVVASDDGVMPQTEESIKHIKDANIPFIVVLTKADAPASDAAKVKNQLLKKGVSLEGLGGDVPVISVSAKTGSGIAELLDLILLVFELHAITKDETSPFQGIVIESRLDHASGPRITLIVKNGKVRVGEAIFFDFGKAKVRALISYDQKNLKEAFPGDPVEILGFSSVIPVGVLISTIEKTEPQNTLAQAPQQSIEEKILSIILKADTEGSLEAIVSAFPSTVHIMEKGTGKITDGDILLAKTTGAIVVGFNTQVTSSALRLAETEHVIIKTYAIIYELLSEITDVLENLKSGKDKAFEEVVGKAEIIGSFPYDKKLVLGVKVTDGFMRKGAKIALVRKGEEIGRATIVSLRQEKEDKGRIEKNQKCGVLLSHSLDFVLGDMLISYS